MVSSLKLEVIRKGVSRVVIHFYDGTKIYARQIKDMGRYYSLNGKLYVPKNQVSEIDEICSLKKYNLKNNK
jgi:Tat protein secretion system quality control protein TatD with DNase activity